MSESMWHKQGETLSHNNAYKEYGLTEKQIIDAIKQGKLQYKQNYAHGNPYFRLLRREIESLAQELLGANGASEQAIKHQLATIRKEINSLKRRLTSLEKQRIQLLKKQNNEKA
jgi:50S ribosomal subunit-associated GTPase HflX